MQPIAKEPSRPFDWKNLTKILNASIPEWACDFHLPGLAIEIWQNGRQRYSLYWGFADVHEKRPIEPHTIFKIASVSKTFTATGLMHYAEEGLIDFEKNVNEFLPPHYAPIRCKNSDLPITLRHLVTHTSGIGELRKLSDAFKKGFNINVYGEKPLPPLSYYFQNGITTRVPPGQKYAYSNNGVGLVGHILELISEISFEDLMNTIILKPLGLESTFFKRTDKIREREATGYLDNRNKGKFRKVRYLQCGLTPAGNGYSTARDLSYFAQMLMNNGKSLDGLSQILSSESITEMFRPWYQAALGLEAMGCIFMRYRVGDRTFLTHDGATSGFTSALLLCPDEKLSIVVLSNVDEIFAPHGTLKIRNRLAHLLTGLVPLSVLKVDEQTRRQMILKIIQEEEKLEETIAPADTNSTPPKTTSTPSETNSAASKTTSHLVDVENKLDHGNFLGTYGPQKGVLTNTRYYMMGAEFYIRERGGSLYLYSLYGPFRKGVKLLVEKPPLKFYFPRTSFGGSLKLKESLVFNRNAKGKIDSFAMGKSRFWKRPPYKSLRVKLYVLLLTGLGLLLLLLLF